MELPFIVYLFTLTMLSRNVHYFLKLASPFQHGLPLINKSDSAMIIYEL